MNTERISGIVRHRMGTVLMVGLLEVITEQLEVMVQETLPVNGIDANVNLNSALSMAMDQAVYGMGILRRRIEENPDQYGLPLTDKEPDKEPSPESPEWCNTCDNPKGACTCRR